MQLLADLPAILRKAFVHAAAEDGVGALAEFGVGVEQAEGGVGRSHAAGGLSRAGVGEAELAVLVVGAGGAGADVDFVVVVLAGFLVQRSRI